jgi:hypothetical protein
MKPLAPRLTACRSGSVVTWQESMPVANCGQFMSGKYADKIGGVLVAAHGARHPGWFRKTIDPTPPVQERLAPIPFNS